MLAKYVHEKKLLFLISSLSERNPSANQISMCDVSSKSPTRSNIRFQFFQVPVTVTVLSCCCCCFNSELRVKELEVKLSQPVHGSRHTLPRYSL